MKTQLGESINKSEAEVDRSQRLLQLRGDLAPKMGPHWNVHSNVFVDRIALSRLLYLSRLYPTILGVPGVICEFGVQWGATLVTLMNLRGMLEPYNYSRKIVGFDTFQGFVSTAPQDGGRPAVGDYATKDGYQAQLEEILSLHEANAPIHHIRKFELVAGDASTTAHEWLSRNAQAIISMAIFDMDVYQPTRDALQAVLPRLVKGSVLVFDELNCPQFPGETAAVMEVLGLNQLRLQRDPHQPFCAWAVWGE
ncbi:MAG: crotonobetainyl-CoA--carnitine CoA-transferase [Burkholderiales bacterium]|nr:crotonobetainyl-CoA--carnitine CoA-transferase [Burkholderiales bacterium]